MISLGCTQRDARHHLPPPCLPHIQNPIHLCKIHFEVLQTQKPGERCTPLKTTVNLQQYLVSSSTIQVQETKLESSGLATSPFTN